MDIRKIFVAVPTEDFQEFKKRCDKEGATITHTLAKLVKMYGHGANIIHVKDPKKKKHAIATGVVYPKGSKNGK